MLTLTFLGVGNAFAKRNFQSNALLETWSAAPDQQGEPDDTLLIDFGATGPQALYQLKDRPGFGYLDHAGAINYPKIRHVFITHQHGDHIAGLEELALMNTFMYAEGGAAFRPQLISSSEILANLWEHSLRGGLGTLNGRSTGLEDYFVIRSLDLKCAERNRFRLADRYELQSFKTDHIRIQEKYDWPSLGFLFHDADSGASTFFSGDTTFDFESYAEMMTAARICFHEVHLGNEELPVHSSLERMRTLPAEIKRKTFLYHYEDDWDSGAYGVVAREFAGFARPFERYVLFD